MEVSATAKHLHTRSVGAHLHPHLIACTLELQRLPSSASSLSNRLDVPCLDGKCTLCIVGSFFDSDSKSTSSPDSEDR